MVRSAREITRCVRYDAATHGARFPGARIFWALILLSGISMAPHTILAEGQPQRAEAVHTPKEIQRLYVNKYINAVAWSMDGSRLAALSDFGGTITLWETKHWTKLNEFRRYSGAYSFNSLAFLPDGTLLTATPGGDYSKDARYANSPLADPHYNRLDIWALIQWDPETGEHVRYLPDRDHLPKDVIPSHVGITQTFTVSRDGSLIAGTFGVAGYGVQLIDAKTGRLMRMIVIPSPKKNDVRSLAFSPDGKELAVGTSQGLVYFYDTKSGALVHSFLAYPTGEYACSALAYSPDGHFIATGKYKNFEGHLVNGVWTEIRASKIGADIWHVSDGKLISSLPGTIERDGNNYEATPVRALSWSPVDDMLAVGDSGSLRLWRITQSDHTLMLDKRIAHGAYSVSFSP